MDKIGFLAGLFGRPKPGGREAPLDRARHANTATGVESSPSGHSHSTEKKVGADIAATARTNTTITSPVVKFLPSHDVETLASAKREHLWDKAYDDLRLIRPDLVSRYEAILSRDIRDVASETSISGVSKANLKETSISETDIEVRWHQMCRQLSWWLDGQDSLQSSQFQHSLRDHIRMSTGAAPPSALAWVCLCYASRISLYPRPETEATCLGLIDIITKMHWYNCLPRLISSGTDEPPEWKQTLQDRVVALYREILSYLMEVVELADNQFDTRELSLASLKAAEENLSTFAGGPMLQQLEEIRILSTKKEARQTTPIREITTTAPSGIDENLACLGELDMASSPVEMNDNGSLTRELCRWVCATEQFKSVVDWEATYIKDDESRTDNKHNTRNQRLLIGGGLGINKTALMEAIAVHLSGKSSLDRSNSYASISREIGGIDSENGPWASIYYSCGRTNHGIDNSARVLRGLINSILKQQPKLILHLTVTLENIKRDRFDSPNDFTALSGVLFKMLKDQAFVRSYLVVDGIDACSSDDEGKDGDCLSDLLRLIMATENIPDKIRWLVSADINHRVKTDLVEAGHFRYIVLEQAYQVLELKEAFHRSVNSMVDELALEKGYSEEIKTEISRIISEKSKDNALWAVTACATLRKEDNWYAVDVLKEMPAELNGLYEYARVNMAKLPRHDPEFCKSVLSTMAVAYRPLLISELARFVDLPPQVDLMRILDRCRPYLEVQSGKVRFADPTARQEAWNYLRNNPLEFSEAHSLIARKALEWLSEYFNTATLGVPNLNSARNQSDGANFSNNYGAIHWLMHLLNVKCFSRDDKTTNAVVFFMQNHFLLWLDTVISAGLHTDVAILMKKLDRFWTIQLREESRIPKKSCKDKRRKGVKKNQMTKWTEKPGNQRFVLTLIQDALQIIYSHKSGNSVFHTNPNSAIFYPEESVLKQHWVAENNDWLVLPPETAQNWSDNSLALANRSDVESLAFSPDGKLLASGSDDSAVRVWDAETGAAQLMFEEHGRKVVCLTFSSNRQLASGSEDGVIHIWDMNTGSRHKTLLCQKYGLLWDIRFSPDGEHLLVGTDMALLLWDVSSKLDGAVAKEPKILEDKGPVRAVDFSKQGRWIASSSIKTVNIRDGFNDNALRKSLLGHEEDVKCVAFSQDEKHLASGSRDNTIKIWDLETGQVVRSFDCGNIVNGVAFSPNDPFIAAGSGTEVWLWRFNESKDPSYVMRGHTKEVTAVAFSRQGHLASGATDKIIWLWDSERNMSNGMNARKEPNKGYPVRCIAMSSDGKYLASSTGTNICLWDGTTGRPTKPHELLEGGVLSISFSPDGGRLVSSSKYGTVTVWDVASGMLCHKFRGHSDYVTSATFSPDGNQVASASDDCSVRIWKCLAEVGKEKEQNEEEDRETILLGHSKFVTTVAFSPNGKFLASGGDDSRLMMWDLASLQLKWEAFDYSGGIESIVFSHDSSKVVSRSSDKSIRVWNAGTGVCIQGPIRTQETERSVGFDIGMPEYFLTEFGADPSTLGSSAFFSQESFKGKRYGISIAGDWITWNGREIIPIPDMYRPTASWVQGNTVAIGTKSGKVLLFRFRPNVEPPN